MGVKHLWEIIGPAGRSVKLESLENRRLAIDTSIWLNHFIKAMRDKKGNLVSNAHIKGLFSRICKMLYFGVRPVFVFDGATPLLKKNTTARRQRAKETSTKKVQQLAEKILLNQLQLASLKELKKSIANGDKDAAKNLLEKLTAGNIAGAILSAPEVISIDEDDGEADVIPLSEFVDEGEFDGLFGSEDEDIAAFVPSEDQNNNVICIDDEEEDESFEDFAAAMIPADTEFAATSFLSEQELRDLNIDSEAFSHLPDDVKREVLSQLQQLQQQQRRSRVRQMLREGDLDARPDPNAFSDLQLKNLIQRSRVTRKIQELTSTLSGNAERPIASSATGRYILRKEGDSDLSSALQRPDGTIVRLRRDGTIERVNSASTSAVPTPEKERSFQSLDPTKIGAFSSTPKRVSASPAPFASPSSSSVRRVIHMDDYADDEEDDDIVDLLSEEEEKEDEAIALDSDDSNLSSAIVVSKKQGAKPFSNDDSVEIVPEASQLRQTATETSAALEIVFDPSHVADEGDEIDFAQFMDVEEPVQPTAPPTPPQSAPSRPHVSAPTVAAVTEVVVLDDSLVADDAADDDEFADEQFEEATPQPASVAAQPTPSAHMQALSISPFTPAAVQVNCAVPVEEAPVIPQTSAVVSSETNLVTATAMTVSPPMSPVEAPSASPRSNSESPQENPPVAPLNEEQQPPAPIHVVASDAEVSFSDRAIVDDSVNDSISSLMIVAPPAASGPSEAIGVSIDALNRSIQSNNEDIWPEQVENMERELQAEVTRMQTQRRAQSGQAQGVTNEMIEDCKELLQLFGVPYVESPGEADAQCAILEQLGLVDGIVSDDSDIFLFGGINVFRHAFDRRYHLELFSMKDIESALELKQEDLINLALLLGSDYTDGIRGIGTISAKDIVSQFRGVDGLKQFRDWIVNGIEHGLDEKSRRWYQKHKNLRQKIKTLDQHFPSREVIDAYLQPLVDNSEEQFEWNCPDLDALRAFCTKKFGWEVEQTDNRVVPIVQRYNQTLSVAQRKIETYFLPLMKKDKNTPRKSAKKAASAPALASASQLQPTEPDFGFFNDEEFLRLAAELEGEESPKAPAKKSKPRTQTKRKRGSDASQVEADENVSTQKKRTPPKRSAKKSNATKVSVTVSDDEDIDDSSFDVLEFEPESSGDDAEKAEEGADEDKPEKRPSKGAAPAAKRRKKN